VQQGSIETLYQNGNSLELLLLLLLLFICLFLTPVLNSREMKKIRYAIPKSTKIQLE